MKERMGAVRIFIESLMDAIDGQLPAQEASIAPADSADPERTREAFLRLEALLRDNDASAKRVLDEEGEPIRPSEATISRQQ